MKPLLTVLTLALSLTAAAVPAQAIGADMSSLTPVLTFPAPDASDSVTKTESGIDK